ncbi:MAG: tRNA (adenosine(37)-N6)-threonylcarbamoyltransferase complex dimerization subunit type 1 TsaB [Pseudomonadota bacterium]
MRILALETATESCSVALQIDGDIRVRETVAPQQHASLLLPWVEELLAEAGIGASSLDAVAVSHGPGSFTGIRIGFSAAQGLAFGADVVLVGISTLEVLAETVGIDHDRVLPVLDARMGEYYFGAYERRNDTWHPVVADCVIEPDELQIPGNGWFAIGHGVDAYGFVDQHGDRLTGADAAALPSATALARLAKARLDAGGEPVPATDARPVYLRNRVARKPG